MEKKVYELRIDPELRDLIPPLSDEEKKMLEDSILRDGCDTPLIVWNGTIVDGHNRYDICRKHGIPFGIEEKDFEDRGAAMFWMLEHQLARRNLNSYQRSLVGLKYESFYREQARKRLTTSTGGKDARPLQNSAEAEKGNAMDKLGKMVGVSRDTLAKVKELDANADEGTKEQLRRGEVSIHRAYTELKNKEHEGETRVCERCGLEKPYTDFNIVSKATRYSLICKECEAKAKQAARDAETAASMPPEEVTGMTVRDGKLAHVPTQLRDDPALFDHVLSLLESATNAYIATCETAISKLRLSMMTEENIDTIRQMIDDAADTVDEMLTQTITEKNEEVQ